MGLSPSRVRRTIRRVLVSNREHLWGYDDFAQAIDPERKLNAGSLYNLLKEHAASVTRALGMITIMDGTRLRFTSRGRAEREYAGATTVTHETRVEAMFALNPRAWSVEAARLHLFDENPSTPNAHSSLAKAMREAASRLGWRVFRDPSNHRRLLFAPLELADKIIRRA